MQKDEDTDNISGFDKTFSGEKNYRHFISYMDGDYKIKSFCIMLPKANAYVKYHESETKGMYFSIGDNELLKK